MTPNTLPCDLQACIEAGLALAAPSRPGATMNTLTSYMDTSDEIRPPDPVLLWVSAAYLDFPPAPDSTMPDDSGTAGWVWVTSLGQEDGSEPDLQQSSLLPVSHLNWAPGYPHIHGNTHVNFESGGPLRSCMAMQWTPGTASVSFVNLECSTPLLQFVRLPPAAL